MKKLFEIVCKKVQEIFCWHDFVRAGFRQAEEGGIRYSIRHYKCQKCGKEVYADGRHDKYAANAITPYHFEHEVL